jgi:ferredoxin
MLGINLDKTKCTDCGLCVSVCKMDIKRVGDHECISCGACIKVCPSKAISWKGSKLLIRENETETPDVSEIKPLASMLKPAKAEIVEQAATETTALELENVEIDEEEVGNVD